MTLHGVVAARTQPPQDRVVFMMRLTYDNQDLPRYRSFGGFHCQLARGHTDVVACGRTRDAVLSLHHSAPGQTVCQTAQVVCEVQRSKVVGMGSRPQSSVQGGRGDTLRFSVRAMGWRRICGGHVRGDLVDRPPKSRPNRCALGLAHEQKECCRGGRSRIITCTLG